MIKLQFLTEKDREKMRDTMTYLVKIGSLRIKLIHMYTFKFMWTEKERQDVEDLINLYEKYPENLIFNKDELKLLAFLRGGENV